MGAKKPSLVERIAQVQADQAEFVARNPGFLESEEAKLRATTGNPPPITKKASLELSKLEGRNEKSLSDAANDSHVLETVTTSGQAKKKRIDPDAVAHDLYHRTRQTDP